MTLLREPCVPNQHTGLFYYPHLIFKAGAMYAPTVLALQKPLHINTYLVFYLNKYGKFR